MLTYEEILGQAKCLSPEEQIKLLEALQEIVFGLELDENEEILPEVEIAVEMAEIEPAW